MKGFLKVIGIAMVFVLMFQTVGVNFASATEINSEVINTKYGEVPDFTTVLPDDTVDEQNGLLRAFVYVASVVVGAVILGTGGAAVEHYTGKTPAEWYAIGIDFVDSTIKNFMQRYNVREIFMDLRGRVIGWTCSYTPCPQP